VDQGVERLRKPEDASGRARQTRPTGCYRVLRDAVGAKNLMEGAVTARSSRERRGDGAAAWSSENSVGEHKPMRGTPGGFSRASLATGSGEDPEAQPVGSEGKRGASNPYGR
jgi:hypothetical protein